MTVRTAKIYVNFNAVYTRDVVYTQEQFSGDGVTTTFNLSKKFKANSLMVYINGILCKKGAGGKYTEGEDLQSITFNVAPSGGGDPDEILACYANN